jgi:mono/diheme cytochrome c family protein
VNSRTKGRSACVAILTAIVTVSACDRGPDKRKMSDAELHLTPTEAAGRRVYQRYCDNCHEPYRDRPLHGPSMKDVFKKPYLPSGVPATDERVREVTIRGRGLMPRFGDTLSNKQIDDLLAYLHTL